MVNDNISTDLARRIINPWRWQDAYGYVQANEIADAHRVLVCSGQPATDADEHLMHAGDMRGQIGQTLDSLETVLHTAGMSLGDVVRLDYYATDVDAFAAMTEFGDQLTEANCKPASCAERIRVR